MSKRPSVTAAMLRRKMEEADDAGLDPAASPLPVLPAGEGSKPVARTRAGKKFITFPVSEETIRDREESSWNPGCCTPIVATYVEGCVETFFRNAAMWALRPGADNWRGLTAVGRGEQIGRAHV